MSAYWYKRSGHPLTHIINASITAGEVPTHWKEAIVVPILKKGSDIDVNNYRPISCLVAAYKVLEKESAIKLPGSWR